MNLRRLALVASVGVLAGCGTSKEARELAIETAAAIQALDVAVSANAAVSKQATASADARIENLVVTTAARQADLQMRMNLDNAAKSEFERLRQFAERQEAERQKTLAAAVAQSKTLADARKRAKSPSPLLKEISAQLTALGKEESTWDQLKATAHFLRDVAKRVKNNGEAAQKEGKNASTSATAESRKLEDAKFNQ